MGINNEYAAKLVLNIETAPMDGAVDYIETPEAPSNYKNAEAIERYITDAKAKALDRCGLDPDLARIVSPGEALHHQPPLTADFSASSKLSTLPPIFAAWASASFFSRNGDNWALSAPSV